MIRKLPEGIDFNGYLKSLQTINDTKFLDELYVDNLIHNRLNFKWYINNEFTAAVEVRSRLFYGSSVKNIPLYGRLIDVGNDVVNLSWLPVNSRSVVIHTVIDRFYLDWTKKKWQVRLGRQRVNWGIGLVWNPNDLFNAFSFYDFDYAERPGSDALRIQYFTGYASGLEFVFKAFRDIENFEDVASAIMWKANRWSYDFQFIGGVLGRDLAIGSGWAGNIKNAGFKGEWMYYHPYDDLLGSAGAFVFSVSSDFSFKNSLYIHGSYLFNSNGQNKLDLLDLAAFDRIGDIDPQNLSPYKHSLFFQVSYPFTPLINGSFAAIYSPGDHALFLNPVCSFSIADNWDLSLLSQVYLASFEDGYQSLSNLYYSQIRWNF